ncbi:MAG: hypothetical protein MK105_13365 [Crocinitomicaceae bacterium]|nr:hypothetical protein [Crocinitomicaceae bacterium]
MSNRELIISLIQEDLKHSQLIVGLDELGLSASEKHCLRILDIVANLMQVTEGHIEFDWGRTYITYMADCTGGTVEDSSDSMRPYAESCYDELIKILNLANVGLSDQNQEGE